MNVIFRLGGSYSLVVGENLPSSPNSVWIQILRHPMPEPPGDCPSSDEIVFSINVAPSHARAIASALLSAATEANR